MDEELKEIIEGMMAENRALTDKGGQPAYSKADFQGVSDPKFKEVYNQENAKVVEKERTVSDRIKSYAAGLAKGGVSIVDNFVKLYETGEASKFSPLMESIVEGSPQALVGYGAEFLRSQGADIPETYAGIDLTTSNSRREAYENHMLEARENGLSIEDAQKLDPTNTIKFEETLAWFDKHTHVPRDKEGNALDYLDMFNKAESLGDYGEAADAFVNEAFGAIPSLTKS